MRQPYSLPGVTNVAGDTITLQLRYDDARHLKPGVFFGGGEGVTLLHGGDDVILQVSVPIVWLSRFVSIILFILLVCLYVFRFKC